MFWLRIRWRRDTKFTRKMFLDTQLEPLLRSLMARRHQEPVISSPSALAYPPPFRFVGLQDGPTEE